MLRTGACRCIIPLDPFKVGDVYNYVVNDNKENISNIIIYLVSDKQYLHDVIYKRHFIDLQEERDNKLNEILK